MPTALAQPRHALFVRRTIDVDGAAYEITHGEGLLGIRVYDVTGDDALVYMEPAAVARLRDDLSRALIAGGRTTEQLSADILANSIRIAFQRIDELKDKSPAEAERLFAAALAHIRSSCPQAFLRAEVRP